VSWPTKKSLTQRWLQRLIVYIELRELRRCYRSRQIAVSMLTSAVKYRRWSHL